VAKAKIAGMARRRRKLETVAYHEAGHAVACFRLKRPFKYVTIVPDDEFHGHVKTGKTPKWFQPDVEVDRKTERWIQREILADFAARAAEHRHTGRASWRDASQDLRNASNLADYLYGSAREVRKYLSDKIKEAEAFVAEPSNWILIEAVAVALMERQTLSAQQVKEVCREALLK
jgi:ATP-dependent Zn protease